MMSGYTKAAAANWDSTFVRAAKLREAGTQIVLTSAEFSALPEYSTTLPTGTTIGRRWKRNEKALQRSAYGTDPFTGALLDWPAEWWMGEYIPDPDPGRIGIIWRPIVVSNGPDGGNDGRR